MWPHPGATAPNFPLQVPGGGFALAVVGDPVWGGELTSATK